MEELAKTIGKKASIKIKFPFSPTVLKQLKTIRDHPISRLHLEVFKNFYPSYDIFQPNVEISILEIDSEGKNATYRFQNSIFLEDSEDYIYHIYIMSGITEGILSRALKTDVLCNIKKIHVSDDKEQSYFDISIKIK